MIGSYCLHTTCSAVYTMEAKFLGFVYHRRNRIFLRERERESELSVALKQRLDNILPKNMLEELMD